MVSNSVDTLNRKIIKLREIPPGMVYVDWDGFFIDRYEVTNKQYKEFNVKTFYHLSGTPEKDKKLIIMCPEMK
jgi:formylglycine-generating enzyme required for sulfatase activity